MQKQILGGILVCSMFMFLGTGCDTSQKPIDLNENINGPDVETLPINDNENIVGEVEKPIIEEENNIPTPPVVENQIALPPDNIHEVDPKPIDINEDINGPDNDVDYIADDFSSYEGVGGESVCGYTVVVSDVKPYADLGGPSSIVSLSKNGSVISSKKYMKGEALTIGDCGYVISNIQDGMQSYVSFQLQ